MNEIKYKNKDYSTTKLCYKLLDDKYLDKNGKIKEEYKFNLNFPEFEIFNSKIISKENKNFDTFLFLPENNSRNGEGGFRTKGYFKFSYEKKNGKWWIVENNKFIKEIELDTEIVKHYDKLPLITIITVVFNGEKYLEETIQNVINQTYPNIEYIIIDGGSTDGTIEIIKKYEDKIDYWVSEKDNGIYDAMNKGISLSFGKWINFMNAGDFFVNNIVIEKIFPFQTEDIIYGNVKILTEKGNETGYKPKSKDFTKKNLIIHQTSVLCHQAIFVKKDIIPFYEKKYKLKGELNWYFDILKKINSYKKLEMDICSYRLGGVGAKSMFTNYIEAIQVLLNQNGIIGLLGFPTIIINFSKKLLKKLLMYKV